MITRLILIRHGITEWNKQGRYCGCRDIGLSAQGKAQVIKLRKSLKNLNFDKIYCSNRKRALQTGSILFGRNGFTKVSGLREINFGVLEGLRHAEIMKKYPVLYKKWLVDPYKARIPKAEPMQVFKKRVLSTINKIVRANSGKTVAAVCHGGVIGVFVGNIMKKDKNFWSYVPASASVTIVEYRKNKLKLMKFNE
jgi:alpha-ribazole phosphatase